MQLHRERHAFEAEGARLVIIGNGAPYFIAGFRERSGYEGPIYTDPELAAYSALELRRDLRSTFSMGTLRRSVDAFRKGFRQTETQGDAFQQGGVFVVAPGGEVIYQFRSQHAGDHPPIEELVTAARRARPKDGSRSAA